VRRARGFEWLFVTLALCPAACTRTGPEHGARGPVHFVREHVTVIPSEEQTRVVGDYHFLNGEDHPVETGIKYPFPIDPDHAFPFLVRVWEERDGGWTPIGFTNAGDAVLFSLRLAPREEKTIRVEYAQQIRRHRAVYIVTTTAAWGEPIRLAEFEFRVPAELRDVQFSFVPDRSEARGDTIVYHYARTDFLPDRDLVMTWQ
jgi:hypothetical protein